MKLYIKQKVFALTDKYNIYDSCENPVYVVNREFFSIGAKFHVCNTMDEELYSIEKKVFAFLAEYSIFKDGLKYATIKKQLTLFKPKIIIESAFGDYQISGDFFGMDFKIERDGQLIGYISKKWLSWGDSYELDIIFDDDPAFFCSLVIAIDHCLHNENNR